MMPRQFVVLWHELPPDGSLGSQSRASHFDLMIDDGAHLLTWECGAWPPLLGERIPVRSLPPHRRAYLEYEGPISGGRGHVQQVDQGICHPETLTTDLLKAHLHGNHFRGTVRIALNELTVQAESDAPDH